MGGTGNPFEPHTIRVTPKITTYDRTGTPKLTDGEPVEVKGKMRPLTSSELNEIGMELMTVYSFSTRRAYPGGTVSTVKWTDHNGTEHSFDQMGEARANILGLPTDNTRVMLRLVGQVVQ